VQSLTIASRAEFAWIEHMPGRPSMVCTTPKDGVVATL